MCITTTSRDTYQSPSCAVLLERQSATSLDFKGSFWEVLELLYAEIDVLQTSITVGNLLENVAAQLMNLESQMGIVKEDWNAWKQTFHLRSPAF